MEPRSLLVTRHDPSTFPKIGNVVKMLPIFGTAREPRKNFEDEKISLRLVRTSPVLVWYVPVLDGMRIMAVWCGS